MDELSRASERQETTGSERPRTLREAGSPVISEIQQPLQGTAQHAADFPKVNTVTPISPVMVVRGNQLQLSIAGMLVVVPDYMSQIIMQSYDSQLQSPMWTAYPDMVQDFETWFTERLKDAFLGRPEPWANGS